MKKFRRPFQRPWGSRGQSPMVAPRKARNSNTNFQQAKSKQETAIDGHKKPITESVFAATRQTAPYLRNSVNSLHFYRRTAASVSSSFHPTPPKRNVSRETRVPLPGTATFHVKHSFLFSPILTKKTNLIHEIFTGNSSYPLVNVFVPCYNDFIASFNKVHLFPGVHPRRSQAGVPGRAESSPPPGASRFH